MPLGAAGFLSQQLFAHPDDGDPGALRLGDELVFLDQNGPARLDGEDRAFELSHHSYRVEPDRGNVEPEILLRLAHFDGNEAVLAELAAAPDRRVGSFHRL